MVSAGLSSEIEGDISRNRKLGRNWHAVVRQWTEASRYEDRAKIIARELIDAIGDTDEGILPWIKRRW